MLYLLQSSVYNDLFFFFFFLFFHHGNSSCTNLHRARDCGGYQCTIGTMSPQDLLPTVAEIRIGGLL